MVPAAVAAAATAEVEEVSDDDFERDSNADLDLECLYSSPPKVEADDN